jgi:CRP-like cAMP-binding protein
VNPNTVRSIPLFASVPRRRRWDVARLADEVGLLAARWERTATVVATSPMRLLVLARQQFRELLFAAPTVAAPIHRAAAARA